MSSVIDLRAYVNPSVVQTLGESQEMSYHTGSKIEVT